MFCPLLPVGNTCVVVPDAPQTPKSRVVVPESLQNAPRRGHVVGVGPDVSDIEIGAYVAWRSLCGTSVEIGEGRWLLLREDDLVCRLGV